MSCCIRNGNTCQYSCLENPMHRWRDTVHGVNKELDTTERLTLFTSITAINIIAASNNVCMYYIHTHTQTSHKSTTYLILTCICIKQDHFMITKSKYTHENDIKGKWISPPFLGAK